MAVHNGGVYTTVSVSGTDTCPPAGAGGGVGVASGNGACGVAISMQGAGGGGGGRYGYVTDPNYITIRDSDGLYRTVAKDDYFDFGNFIGKRHEGLA